MKAYLVTGGLGFLGARLVRALTSRGHRVRVLDNASRGSTRRLQGFLDDVEIVHGDIRDAATVDAAVRGVDAVCHLAFVNGTQYFYTEPARVLEVGVKGISNVLDACIRAGIGELVVASSSEVYQTPPHVPTDERVPLSVPDPHNPRYSYGGAKIISELMAIHYGRQHFERVLIFRPHNVFGPDMGWEHVIPQFIDYMLRLKQTSITGPIPFSVQGDGQQSRAFVYIDDFIAGLLLVMDRGEHLNIYNIGTTEELMIGDVAHQIAAHLGATIRIVPGPEAVGGALRRCPDITKIRRLGFEPRFTFRQALEPTVRWYAEHWALDERASVARTRQGR